MLRQCIENTHTTTSIINILPSSVRVVASYPSMLTFQYFTADVLGEVYHVFTIGVTALIDSNFEKVAQHLLSKAILNSAIIAY